MAIAEDRPSIDERYAQAMHSNHLQVQADTRGDVDLLIAVGWVREGLGADLYRLRSEFDVVRGEQHQAHDNARAAMADVRRVRAMAMSEAVSEFDRQELLMQAGAMLETAQRALETARALLLSRLKSRRLTREALSRYAMRLAARCGAVLTVSEIDDVAGQALDAWLDPWCWSCEGRGFHGGPGVPRVLCNVCHGSRRQHLRLGDTRQAWQFGRLLLAQMDRKADAVDQDMLRYLRQHGPRPDDPAAELNALRERLHGLRSARAQED